MTLVDFVGSHPFPAPMYRNFPQTSLAADKQNIRAFNALFSDNSTKQTIHPPPLPSTHPSNGLKNRGATIHWVRWVLSGDPIFRLRAVRCKNKSRSNRVSVERRPRVPLQRDTANKDRIQIPYRRAMALNIACGRKQRERKKKKTLSNITILLQWFKSLSVGTPRPADHSQALDTTGLKEITLRRIKSTIRPILAMPGNCKNSIFLNKSRNGPCGGQRKDQGASLLCHKRFYLGAGIRRMWYGTIGAVHFEADGM